jgi:hypothetical protein
MIQQVTALTPEQTLQMSAHADRWIAAGLSTCPADRPAFETAARRCYELAGVPWHGRVIWVGSPPVLALAAPIAAILMRWQREGPLPPGPGPANGIGLRTDALKDVLYGSESTTLWREVEETVAGALRGVAANRVQGAVNDAVGSVVRGAVNDPVGGVLDLAVRGEVHYVVNEVVSAAIEIMERGSAAAHAYGWLEQAVGAAVREALAHTAHMPVASAADLRTIQEATTLVALGWLSGYGGHIGGQFWAGGRNRSPAQTSFLREVCDLELPRDLWERAIAYEATALSACWWLPHKDFLMVCERPREIHRELVNPDRLRGVGSHHLHRGDGPALLWPDGWSVWALHGRFVPAWIVEDPERITVAAIDSQENAEVRRLMIELYGWERYIRDCGAEVIDRVPMDHEIRGLRGARLLRKHLSGEPEPIVYLEMLNSSPEPDGTYRRYLERIDPKIYNGDAGRRCHAAMASRWRYRDAAGQLQLTFMRWQDYRPTEES